MGYQSDIFWSPCGSCSSLGSGRGNCQLTVAAGRRFETQNFRDAGISPKNGPFREKPAERKSQGQKWVKLLSKLILDFSLAKGKSTVEFREGLWRQNGQRLAAQAYGSSDDILLPRRSRE